MVLCFYLSESLESRDIPLNSDIGIQNGNGNTTREGSGGYGLPTLLDYIKKVEGDLTILSGDEIFSLKKGNKDFQEKINSFFPGTAICFKIKLFDLDKLFEYDKKNKTISTRRISLNDI